MSNADDMFAAAFRIAERIVEQRAAHRKALRDAANARRRARYAARPKPEPNATLDLPLDGDDLYYEPGCRCHVVAMAPCSWCEDGGYYDDNGNPVTPEHGEIR